MYKLVDQIQPEEKEMRATFAAVLEELADADKRVMYLDCDVSNSIGTAGFGKKYPKQFVNCGIQEANMISVASGISATGLIPFTHTFGCFASRRVIDQIYISAAYSQLNVKMFGSDPGVTAAYNGGTHMPIEDVGLLRTIPEVTIIEATDSVMLADLMRQVKDLYGVYYIRISRKIAERIFQEGSQFNIGKAASLVKGSDATIFATGIGVADALRAREVLKEEGYDVAVQNMFTIKPIDREAVIRAAEETGAIVTVENHNIINGLGSAVAEVVVEQCPVPMKRIGVPDRFGEVGSIDYLKGIFGMTESDIVTAVKDVITRKEKS
ncbi:MAG TPA: transketolase family protein [Clostridiaceae bacterium]|nr:transketolase family protein [Clostridiaceae bacterium]